MEAHGKSRGNTRPDKIRFKKHKKEGFIWRFNRVILFYFIKLSIFPQLIFINLRNSTFLTNEGHRTRIMDPNISPNIDNCACLPFEFLKIFIHILLITEFLKIKKNFWNGFRIS